MNFTKKILFISGDVLALILSFIGTLIISFPNDFSNQVNLHQKPFLLMYLIWILVLYVFNLYDNQNTRPTVLKAQKISLALITCGILGISMFYFLPIFSISPKSNLFINVVLFGLFLIPIRRALSEVMNTKLTEKIAILGKSKESEEIFNLLKDKNNFGYKAIIITDQIEEIFNSKEDITNIIIPKNINTDDLMKIAKSGVRTTTLVKAYERFFEKIPVSLVDDDITVEILSKERNFLYNLFSRILGITVGISILILTLPITFISSIIIKLEDGRKIFYKQKRVGENGKNFEILKFQSMKENAEKDGAVWAQANDSRITKFGNVLRKLHIDEIPQMLNIIKGDINLVGPRPERPEFVEKLEKEIPYYFLRHSIKPGFTGWAQIKYRYARTINDSQDKLEYDLYYLKNKNIFLDLGVILKTVQIIFTH